MTEFKVSRGPEGYRISCRNHAIPDVCRGVSALIFAMAQTLTVEHELGRDIELKMTLTSGEAYISVYPKKEYEERTKLILRTCALGMMTIQASYPDEVVVDAQAVLDDCFRVGEKSEKKADRMIIKPTAPTQ